jgi:hypothetical protein
MVDTYTPKPRGDLARQHAPRTGLAAGAGSTPPIIGSGAVTRSMASTAVPSAPMFSEGVETIIYFQNVDDMWGLFSPFAWQLWVSIVCMVSTPSCHRSLR